MKKFLILLFAYPLIAVTLFSQTVGDNYILIEQSAALQVPADIIVFNLSLTAEDIDPKAAFEKHKRQENELLKLLSQLNIPDSNITYSLLRISGSSYRKNEPKYYVTNQSVSFILDDFKTYEKIQISLLEGDILNFNSNFSLSDAESFKSKAMLKAVEAAAVEAGKIAEKCNRKLGKVLAIEHGSSISYRDDIAGSVSLDSKSSLVNIPQMVNVYANVRIKYELKD